MALSRALSGVNPSFGSGGKGFGRIGSSGSTGGRVFKPSYGQQLHDYMSGQKVRKRQQQLGYQTGLSKLAPKYQQELVGKYRGQYEKFLSGLRSGELDTGRAGALRQGAESRSLQALASSGANPNSLAGQRLMAEQKAGAAADIARLGAEDKRLAGQLTAQTPEWMFKTNEDFRKNLPDEIFTGSWDKWKKKFKKEYPDYKGLNKK